MGNRAVIFDLDGTLANCQHRLHHVSGHKKHWDAFFEGIPDDPPVYGVVSVLRAMARDNNIVLTTGRPEKCREMTEEWLNKHVVPYDVLYMRADGDLRPDNITKAQIYEGIKQDGYDVYLAIDDRKSIVDLWRSLGICTLQCAPYDDLEPASGTLTLAVGPSGAGKSHYLFGAVDASEIVSSDRIREYLCADFRDQSKNDQVFAAVHSIAKARITSGLPCTIDATHLRRQDRLASVALARGGPIRYLVFDRPLDEKRRDGSWRNEIWKDGKPFDLIGKHHQTFQSQLKDILAGDNLPNVQVFDQR